MLILEEFWRGDLVPGEGKYRPNSQLTKTLQTIEKCGEVLKAELSEAGKAALNDLQDAEQKLSAISDCGSFVEGFRIGAKMMMDILLNTTSAL